MTLAARTGSPLAQPAEEGVLRRLRRDPDPRVDRDRAVRPGDDRVEVELGDLRKVVAEPGDAQQHVAQRGQVAAGAHVAVQQRGGRTEPISASASASVSGASLAAWSASASVATPPSPNTTSGPNIWSSGTPTITSVPPVIIGWTPTPLSRAPNWPASFR